MVPTAYALSKAHVRTRTRSLPASPAHGLPSPAKAGQDWNSHIALDLGRGQGGEISSLFAGLAMASLR